MGHSTTLLFEIHNINNGYYIIKNYLITGAVHVFHRLFCNQLSKKRNKYSLSINHNYCIAPFSAFSLSLSLLQTIHDLCIPLLTNCILYFTTIAHWFSFYDCTGIQQRMVSLYRRIKEKTKSKQNIIGLKASNSTNNFIPSLK